MHWRCCHIKLDSSNVIVGFLMAEGRKGIPFIAFCHVNSKVMAFADLLPNFNLLYATNEQLLVFLARFSRYGSASCCEEWLCLSVKLAHLLWAPPLSGDY